MLTSNDDVADFSDDEVIMKFPGILLTKDNIAHYRGLLRRKLLINRCQQCGLWRHPPRPICPACWSRDVHPTAVSGRGVLHMVIFLHQGPPAPGIDYSTPHPVATVSLAEQVGLRYTSTLAGLPTEQMQIGLPVELIWIDRGGRPVPAFGPVRSEVQS